MSSACGSVKATSNRTGSFSFLGHCQMDDEWNADNVKVQVMANLLENICVNSYQE